MKCKLPVTIALCMTGSLLAGSLIARQQEDPGNPNYPNPSGTESSQNPSTMSPTGAMPSARAERLSQVMGGTVKSTTGETLGQINDFVISPHSGRIQFAVISLSSQPGKLTAVPWQLLRPSGEPNTFTLHASKEKLDTAPTFDASSWPDVTQPQWSQQIYSYYGVQPPSRMGGHVPMGGESGGGMGQQPGGTSQQQQPGSQEQTYPR